MLIAEIDLRQLKRNVERVKTYLSGSAKLYCVVKADAYGHGSVEAARAIELLSDQMCVATFDEAIELKRAGIKKRINILGCENDALLGQKALNETTMCDVIPCITTVSDAKYINSCIKEVNIKFNSGMNRTGADEKDLKKIHSVLEKRGIKVTSVFTHFYNSNSDYDVQKQYEKYEAALNGAGLENVKKHCAASGFMRLDKKYQCDAVRCGIALYGYSIDAEIRPVMSVYTNILQTFDVKKGEHISYGEFVAPKDLKIAAIRAGYADGFRRLSKDKERYVSINGILCPVMGQVCMDITLIDVSNIKLSGREVVYILGGKASGQMLADSYDTIIYEVLTGFSKRVKRIYI